MRRSQLKNKESKKKNPKDILKYKKRNVIMWLN